MPSRASSVRPNPSDPQLPKEIIDDIIDYLADDVAALRAFALTGRTLLHRARMHLFACITLEGGPAFLDRGVTPGRKFLALVRESPYLLGYIKEVRVLNLNEAWMDDWVGCDLALGFSIGVFLRTLEARLPEVGAGVGAGVVSGVQLVPPPSVSLRSVVLERIDWQEIPGGHRVSLEDLVVFPTVKDVTLKQIRGMSWETCERFPAGLEKLWLFAVDFFPLVEADSDTDDGWDTSDDEQDDVIVDASGDGIKRQTAERRGFRVLLPTTRSKQTFPSLRALAIHRGSLGRDASLIFAKNTFFPLLVSDLRAFLTSSWSEREWRHNKEILARIIPMNLLESFGLGFFWRRDGPLPEYDLSPCTNLRTIHIGTYSDFHTFALQAAFVWLHESLQNLPPTNRLEQIIVRCCLSPTECSSIQHIHDYKQHPAGQRLKRNLDWEGIDKALSGTRFGSLRNIHLRLSVNERAPTNRYAMLINSLSVILPRLMKSDIVTIEGERKRFRWPPERIELY